MRLPNKGEIKKVIQQRARKYHYMCLFLLASLPVGELTLGCDWLSAQRKTDQAKADNPLTVWLRANHNTRIMTDCSYLPIRSRTGQVNAPVRQLGLFVRWVFTLAILILFIENEGWKFQFFFNVLFSVSAFNGKFRNTE